MIISNLIEADCKHIFNTYISVMSRRFFPSINSIDCFWWVITFHEHILS